MSHMNKPLVEQSFDMVRQCIKSSVPPCTTTVDTPTHYESVAINGDQKHLFGFVVAHQDVITVGINEEIPEEDLKQMVSERLLKMMNQHRRFEIRTILVKDLHQDVQDAFNNLLYYYNQIGWTKI